MTDKEFEALKLSVDKELAEYMTKMLETSKENIYDNAYEINAYETLHNYIYTLAENYERKYFPPKNIIADVYYRFMKTDYNIDDYDMFDFMENYVSDNKKYNRFNCEEM